MNETNRPAPGTEAPAGRDAHASHDGLLVAALAADDLEGQSRASAERMVATCAECRRLVDDIRAIASATATMPAMPRTRDFRLTEGDAARLRPMGWRRLAAALAGARFALSRPLAVGLTTMGLAGLLLSAIPGQLGFLGSAGAATARPADAAALGQKALDAAASARISVNGAPQVPVASMEAYASMAAASAAATAGPPNAPSAASSAPPLVAASSGPRASGGGGSNPGAVTDISPRPTTGDTAISGHGSGTDAGGQPPDASGANFEASSSQALTESNAGDRPAPLAVVSLLLVLAGVALFTVRWIALRVSR